MCHSEHFLKPPNNLCYKSCSLMVAEAKLGKINQA